MSPNDIVARTRHELSLCMAEEPGLRQIKDLALGEHLAYSEERMDEIVSGCLQWLAAAFMLPRGAELLMFEGLVESFLRLVILDTGFFEHLQRKYSDGPVLYKPLLVDRKDTLPFQESIGWTLEYLRGAFGDALSPELARWDHSGHDFLIPVGRATR